MKTLEEIEQLSAEELEQKATESPAAVPEGLRSRLRMTLAAQEFLAGEEAEKARPVRWFPYATLATAVAAATLLVALPGRGPKDTFDDPLLAYAEVEKAFQTISDKMSVGVDLVREAGATAEIPQNTLHKIQIK